ncbi:hypothetical protein GH975_05500 [Litorivicinus lipolyticus]|uniref:Solute-binding protein family 3/N-terminal domain-containing protein n=1 Tax=Litorivicinus lipolyticus TaxID=418701 RepID=A0A5Q2Q7Q3_9GAMM|nr:hypothetical protein [Litorivicinus lipolyticus]QGG80058.1 hypothetical protein GH975_05500 [Litorivicinus lipolyticus]
MTQVHRAIACALLMSTSAVSAERLGVETDHLTLIATENAARTGADLGARLGRTITGESLTFTHASQLQHLDWVILRAMHYREAISLGWTAIARSNRSQPIAPFVVERKPLRHIATPGLSSSAHWLAKVLVPEAVTVEAYLNNANCLRAVIAGQVDACLTTIAAARGYTTRYGTPFKQVGRGINLPGDVLFRAPSMAGPTRIDALNGLRLTDGLQLTQWQSFDHRYYDGLLARLPK